MARVTVEDCIDKVENRFDLVLLASHRARMISSGTQITVDRDNDKNPVVALREIADEAVSPEDLKEELVHSLQKYVEVDEPEPESVPLIGAPGTGADAAQGVPDDRQAGEALDGVVDGAQASEVSAVVLRNAGARAPDLDHVGIAAGAGKPTIISMKNNLIRGVRKASDF